MSILTKAKALGQAARELAVETASTVRDKAAPIAASAVENLTELVEQGKDRIGVLVDPKELARLQAIEIAAQEVVRVHDESLGIDALAAVRISDAVVVLRGKLEA